MPQGEKRDIRDIKNKIVRGQLVAAEKKAKAQAKLRKRIARKEAEQRGEEVERGEYTTDCVCVRMLMS
jgi:ribosome production factor 1